jgi:lipopolysaccharide biosynthesis glycosyltransferase
MSSPITVVYSFDSKYAHYAAVSTYSLAAHSTTPLRIVWIIPDTDTAGILPIAEELAGKFDLHIDVVPVAMAGFTAWKVSHHFTLAMYLRLLIPSLIPGPRALYLDADTLVLKDLSALYFTDLGGNLIAGVIDGFGHETSKVPRADGDPYLNSGVLLMDLDALRSDRMLEKATALYLEHEHELAWPDQCVINKYAEGRKLVLHPGWNCRVSAYDIGPGQFDGVLSEPDLSILHFVSFVKPWQTWSDPRISDFWWQYARRAQIDGLAPQEVSTVGQAILFTHMLDKSERFREASKMKSDIISFLMDSGAGRA